MFKMRFPCDVTATAENAMRVDDAVKLANQIAADVDAHPPLSRAADESFGDKLKKAVEARLPSRSRQKKTTAANSDVETFAQKLVRFTREKQRRRV